MDKKSVIIIGLTIILVVYGGIRLLGYQDEVRRVLIGKKKPKSGFELERTQIVSENGYPTLVLNYPLMNEGVKFYLYTPDNEKIDESYRKAQTTETSLKLKKEQWETPKDQYRLKVTDASNQKNVLLKQVLKFEPPHIEIKDIQSEWEETTEGYKLTELWVRILNTGDLPVYLPPWYADAKIVLENKKGGLPKEDYIYDFDKEGTAALVGNTWDEF